MAVPKNKTDDALLKNLVPLNTLSEEQLGQLLTRIVIQKARKGDYLFQEGDSDHQNIYLLEGTVALLSGQKEMDLVSSGTQTARFALAHQLPRKHSARAKTAVTYVCIDSRMLSEMLARCQKASYEVDEAESVEKSDWMSQLLRSPVFQQIPPANLQRVMMRMQQITVEAGETIIRQGEDGDYFYLISKGTCRVTRQPEDDHPPVELAQLKAGQGFGEESLISDKPRSSTVTMNTDGELVRLSKQDFVELVKQPLFLTIDYSEALRKSEKQALWVDVRVPEEYEAGHLPGAINLPFFSIRFQASSLANERAYLIYGAEAGQSATAAYLLLEHGYEVFMIREDWDEIALLAGIDKQTTTAAPDNVIDFNRDAEPSEDSENLQELLAEETTGKDLSHLQQQLTSAKAKFAQKLTQYQTEQKLLKQALIVARRKLEAREKEAQQLKQSQGEEIARLHAALKDGAEAQAKTARTQQERDQSLQRHIGELEQKLAQLQDELAASRTEILKLNEERSGLDAQLAREREDLAQVRSGLESQLDGVRQQLAAAVATHQAEAQQTGEQAAEYVRNIEEMEARLQTLQLENEQFRNQAMELQAGLEAQRDQLQRDLEESQSNLSRQEQAAAEQIAGLQQELDGSREQLNRKAEEYANLSAQRERLTAELTELQALSAQQGEQSLAERNSLALQIQQLNEQRASLEDELGILRQSSDTASVEYQGMLDGLKADLSQAQARISELTQTQLELTEQREAVESRLNTDLQASNAREDSLKQALEESVRHQSDLQTAKQTLEQTLSDLQQSMALEKSEREQLADSYREATATLERLNRQLTELQADSVREGERAQELEASVRALEEQRSGLQQELEALRQAGNDADARYQAQLNDARAELEQTQSTLAELTQNHQRQSAERDDRESSLQSELDDAKSQIERLREELQASQDAHKAMESELTRQSADFEGQLQAERQSGEQRLQQAEAEKQEQVARSVELEQRLQDEQAAQAHLRQELADLEERVEALQQANADLQQQAAQADTQHQESLSALREKLESAENEVLSNVEALEETRAELRKQDDERIKLSARLEETQRKSDFLKRSLETAEEAIEISDTALHERDAEFAALQASLDTLNAEKVDLERRLSESRESQSEQEKLAQESIQALNASLVEQEQALSVVRAELETARSEESEREAAHKLRQEALQAEKGELEKALADSRQELQAQNQKIEQAEEQQRQKVQGLEQALEAARSELNQSAGTGGEAQKAELALQTAQQEILGLKKTIVGLREVQLEMEAQSSEGNEAEITRLQAALELEEQKRRQAEQLARQTDVLRREREVQETAVEMLGEDLECLTQEKTALESENSRLASQLAELRDKFSDFLDENGQLKQDLSAPRGLMAASQLPGDPSAELDEMRARVDRMERERDQARAQSERLKGEVEELRSVMQTYVGQIQNAQSYADDDELKSLHSELEMVRKQAEVDLGRMREELAETKERLKGRNGRDIDEAASLQAQRQEMDSIRQALHEKEHMLRLSQSQCRTLEDSIEDRDREVDHLKRKLEILIRKTGGLGEDYQDTVNADTLPHSFADTRRQTGFHEVAEVGDSQKASKFGRIFGKK